MILRRRKSRTRTIRTLRAEITVETEIRIAPSPNSSQTWCERCRRKVATCTPEVAAEIAVILPNLLYQSIDAGVVHFSEGEDGLVLICRNSLLHSDLFNVEAIHQDNFSRKKEKGS